MDNLTARLGTDSLLATLLHPFKQTRVLIQLWGLAFSGKVSFSNISWKQNEFQIFNLFN